MKTCDNCGKENQHSAPFCFGCGQSLSSGHTMNQETAASPAPVPSVAGGPFSTKAPRMPSAPGTPAMPPPPTAEGKPGMPPPPPAAPEKKKGLKGLFGSKTTQSAPQPAASAAKPASTSPFDINPFLSNKPAPTVPGSAPFVPSVAASAASTRSAAPRPKAPAANQKKKKVLNGVAIAVGVIVLVAIIVTPDSSDQKPPVAMSTAASEAYSYSEVENGPAPLEPATLTVGNCLSDSAVLYMDGVPMAEIPVGGVVTLPAVPLYSEVRITVQQGENLLESCVTFDDPSVTAMLFENYVVIPPEEEQEPAIAPQVFTGQVTVEEMDAVLGEFYVSYLRCINYFTPDLLMRATDLGRNEVLARLERDGNNTRYFEYISVAVDPASIITAEDEGRPSLLFNATFDFYHRPRDGSTGLSQSSNHQSVQLVYDGTQWLVNRFVLVSDEDFANQRFADFQ